MAAPKYTDRILAQEVRSLTLKEIKAVLIGGENEFKKALILKLAATVLPRLNEVTGEEGGAIKVTIELAGEIAQKNALTSNTEGNSEGQP